MWRGCCDPSLLPFETPSDTHKALSLAGLVCPQLWGSAGQLSLAARSHPPSLPGDCVSAWPQLKGAASRGEEVGGGGLKGLQGLWATVKAEGCSSPRVGGWRRSLKPLSPSRAGRVPGCCCSPPHPPIAWLGLRASTDPPCFSKKIEAQRVPQSSSVTQLAARSRQAQGSVQRSCSFLSSGGELPSGSPPVTLLGTPGHNPLSPPKQRRCPWSAGLLESHAVGGQCEALLSCSPAATNTTLPW